MNKFMMKQKRINLTAQFSPGDVTKDMFDGEERGMQDCLQLPINLKTLEASFRNQDFSVISLERSCGESEVDRDETVPSGISMAVPNPG